MCSSDLFPSHDKIIKKTKSAKKVVATNHSGDLTNTLESRRASFMNRGLEVLGSGLNERKAIASLWSVLKSHKPEMDNELFNTLANLFKKPVTAKTEAKVGCKVGDKKVESKVKKMSKVVNFSKSNPKK